MARVLLCVVAAGALSLAGGDVSNDYGPPEYGHGLTDKDAAAGWIALFDGSTTFGWSGGSVRDGVLQGGTSTFRIRDGDLKAYVAQGGSLVVGDQVIKQFRGMAKSGLDIKAKGPATLQLRDGLAVQRLAFRPRSLRPLLDAKQWKALHHPKLPEDRQAKWAFDEKAGTLVATGGPGAMEYQGGRFGDFILQVEARSLAKHTNGGVFFRTIPGSFMNGYEAQIYSRCIDNDPAKPFKWATGAIDDRQNARRLVSRDGVPFVMTVIANGPHLATWVNGYQTTDWTDSRPAHENPRQGLRVEPGTIQLQAHDADTRLEFRRVDAAAW